jgi:putative transposase
LTLFFGAKQSRPEQIANLRLLKIIPLKFWQGSLDRSEPNLSSQYAFGESPMPRANRFQQPEMVCHLTHRCHNRSFLLGFARDRTEYRKRLRQASKKFGVSLLNYCLTSNHTHEIAIESRRGGISRMMQQLEGDFASFYNQRKHRSGSFWEDRYHCTMVEDGEHLWNCIQYIDLNMVRAGVVSHPCEWQWCGYKELIGEKARYRLLDMDRLLELLGKNDIDSFSAEYQSRIRDAIAEKKLNRQKCWTESIAVGGKEYATKIAASIRYERLKPRIEEREDGFWLVWEESSYYHTKQTGCQSGYSAQTLESSLN